MPEKICATCGRPFAWRRKWAKDWEQVKYCSAACRTNKQQASHKPAGQCGAG